MTVFYIVVFVGSKMCLISKLHGANYLEDRSNPITDF